MINNKLLLFKLNLFLVTKEYIKKGYNDINNTSATDMLGIGVAYKNSIGNITKSIVKILFISINSSFL